MEKNKHNIELLSDDAIKTKKEDEFGRGRFVNSIAEIIHSQSSKVNSEDVKGFKNIDENMIIGLFGSWGFGKSSILNLLDENLKERELKTLFFNPWIYASEDQLIHSLFTLIASNTGLTDTPLENLVNNFIKYSDFVSIVSSSAGKLADALDHLKEGKKPQSALDYKKAIDGTLGGLSNPIVIFIDDVDRLSKSEVHVLFKTLRLVASFRNVIYVIACDFDMVAKSIKENYEDGSIEDGKSFLEKIIQIPVRIPEIEPALLLNFGIGFLKKTTNIDVSKNATFALIFNTYFKTPRDVIRFINGFRFVQNYLKDEVPEMELILLELIRVKVHSLFEIIKIYYDATNTIGTDNYYNRTIEEFFQKNKPEYFNGSEGKLNERHSEYDTFNVIFSSLFGSNLRSLHYTILDKTRRRRAVKYDIMMRDGYFSQILINPTTLGRYMKNYANQVEKEEEEAID